MRGSLCSLGLGARLPFRIQKNWACNCRFALPAHLGQCLHLALHDVFLCDWLASADFWFQANTWSSMFVQHLVGAHPFATSVLLGFDLHSTCISFPSRSGESSISFSISSLYIGHRFPFHVGSRCHRGENQVFPPLHSAMDSIRDPAELRQALQFIYNTDAQQLSTVMRAGPGEGRSKLLMALTLSTDSALRFHYDSPAESSIDKGTGKGKDPVRRTDNSTSTDPLHSGPSDATPAVPPKTEEARHLHPLQRLPLHCQLRRLLDRLPLQERVDRRGLSST